MARYLKYWAVYCLLISLFLSACKENAEREAAAMAARPPEPLPTIHVTAVAPIAAQSSPVALTPTPVTAETMAPTSTSTFTSTPLPLSEPTASATVNALLTSVALLFPTETAAPSPTIPALILVNGRKVPLTAGAPQSYFGFFRLVSYYGHPNSAELGILGQQSRPAMVQQLRQVAAEYQNLLADYAVLPTLHFIATVADAYPGPNGFYRRQTSLELIAEWREYAHQEGLAFIIDIQPGRADLEEEFQRIRHFLYHPHVHLALDPEFMMAEGEVPGVHLGHIQAAHINIIQAELNQIALAIGLNKVLIIHQFETMMVRDKELILDFPFVELLFNADGFGPPASKIADLHQYASEPGWEYAGIKLFYDWDAPLLTPAQVMNIEPQPVLIVYQ
jgi:hypothetical protein